MYDYSAADDDEVSFMDGDVIEDVQQIDEGWMYGRVQRTGQQGMLPANYVEAIWVSRKESWKEEDEEEVVKGRERRKRKAQCHLILTPLSLNFLLFPNLSCDNLKPLPKHPRSAVTVHIHPSASLSVCLCWRLSVSSLSLKNWKS